jgi:Ca2+-binding RTX toxin-like protein
MRRITGRGLPALVLVLAIVAMAPVAAFGAGGGGQGPAPQPATPDEASRLAPDLAALEDAFAAGGGPAAADFAARSSLFVSGGIVEVEVLTDGADGAAAAAVRSAGGIVVVAMPGFVGAEMPLGSLRALSGGRGVRWVQSPAPVYPEAVNTSQALAVMDVDDWHAAGFRGEGVDVAVVDSGFKGYAAAQASGDLPGSLQIQDYCDSAGFGTATEVDHGAGVAEIVYDIAPAADLWLVCIDNSLDLAEAITWMGQNGIDIFNASLGLLAAYPGDGTGTLKTYSTTAEKAGVTWVNSAGNYALNHWGGDFNDTDGDVVHEFTLGTPGDEGFSFTLINGAQAQVLLRWYEWPSATNDLNLYLYQGGGTAAVAQSTGLQTGTQPPKEGLVFQNTTGSTQTYHIVVQGPAVGLVGTPQLDLFFLPTNQAVLTPVDTVVAAGSLNDASTMAKVLSVGAINWDPGASISGVFVVEDFSSRGPTLGGLTKPDVAGYDGVDTFTYPYNGPPGGPWGFFGTSAASPHVTGAAVLLLQANPDFTPAQLRAAVKSHTVNVFPAGSDNMTGKGRVVLKAPPAWPTCDGKAATIIGSGDADTLTGTAAIDVIVGFGGDDTITGLGKADTVCAGKGDDTVLGGLGNDVVYGGGGNDELDGAGGNDMLYGEAGDDQLDGGPGADTVDGGDGTDTCVGETPLACEP